MGHTGRWPSEGRGRDGNTLHQLGDLWSLQELEEPRKGPLLRCQSSADTLILDFWPSDHQERKFLLFEAIQLVVLCYRSPGERYCFLLSCACCLYQHSSSSTSGMVSRFQAEGRERLRNEKYLPGESAIFERTFLEASPSNFCFYLVISPISKNI